MAHDRSSSDSRLRGWRDGGDVNIVHTEASCGWGGQEIRVLEESKGMIERGHRLTVLCPVESRIHEEAARWGVPVEALPIGRKNLKGLLALRRWLKAHHVDVINTHSSTDSWLAGLACASLRHAPPIVRTRHISASVSRNAATRWLYTKATRHIVTTGEALRRALIESNGYPATMLTSIPTGIDPQRFRPGDKSATRERLGLDPAAHYLGIVATLRSWKGHLYLLDAFSQLIGKSGRSDWQLLVVGEGPMLGNIQNRVAELKLSDRVKLVGQQRNPEEWLRAMDIFCLPSYANEGVPQSVLQAMLTELPIITTPVGAIGEAIVNECGYMVPPKDAARLAQAIGGLIDNPEQARRMARNARQRALNKFSREAMLDHMETIFRAVAA